MSNKRTNEPVIPGTPGFSFTLQQMVLRVCSPKIRGIDRQVLCGLARFVNDRGQSRPGRKTLSTVTGYSERTIADAIARLAAMGLIRCHRPWRAMCYIFDFRALAALVPDHAPSFKVRTSALADLASVQARVSSPAIAAVWLAIAARDNPRRWLQREIAAYAGVGIRVVHTALAELVALGLALVEDRVNGSRDGTRVIAKRPASTPASPAGDEISTEAVPLVSTPAKYCSDPCTSCGGTKI